METYNKCECGDAMGQPCEWTGPDSETVTIEWMPDHMRASHAAAGTAGEWPHNGSRRLRVERSCAAHLMHHDGDWTSIIRQQGGGR